MFEDGGFPLADTLLDCGLFETLALILHSGSARSKSSTSVFAVRRIDFKDFLFFLLSFFLICDNVSSSKVFSFDGTLDSCSST
ncbi:hypothetical protein HanRHA438_Chr04g0164531 [Helianthus annuus]|nr:hypothetical protein HanRHA438_Chr04g0164531 [Helianthus annuus]